MTALSGTSELHVLGFSEPVFRMLAFAGIFVLLAVFEYVRPKRPLLTAKWRRWSTNLAIVAIGSLLIRVLGALAAPLVAVGAALLAAEYGIGLFNTLAWPPVLETLIAIRALDFPNWAQPPASHKTPVVWRLAQVHHADRDIDLATGIRFHPVEIGLSM